MGVTVMITNRGRPKYSEKIPEPVCPPHIPQGLPWHQIRASVLRRHWLTVWAMPRHSQKNLATRRNVVATPYRHWTWRW